MDKCFENNKKVKVEIEPEAKAKAVAVNKNWNIQYATVINKSPFVNEEDGNYKKIAGDPEKIEDLASKLKDKYDGEDGIEIEAEAKSKAIIRNNNVNLIFVDTGNISVVID